jgi:hypothetical protein
MSNHNGHYRVSDARKAALRQQSYDEFKAERIIYEKREGSLMCPGGDPL